MPGPSTAQVPNSREDQNGMAQDYSWERQGREYEDLYAALCR